MALSICYHCRRFRYRSQKRVLTLRTYLDDVARFERATHKFATRKIEVKVAAPAAVHDNIRRYNIKQV